VKTILLVDDDAIIIQVYRAKLLREGFVVEVAQDGLTAMKLLKAEKPDLVVLDLMMPKFSGADVLKFIRADPALKSTPVIVLSNAYMTDLARQAADVGAEAAVLKSDCTPAQLLDAVSKLLTGATPQAEPASRLAVEGSIDALVRS